MDGSDFGILKFTINKLNDWLVNGDFGILKFTINDKLNGWLINNK